MPAQDDSGHDYGRPARWGFAITPNDFADLPFVTRAIYVGGPGDINVVLLGKGDTVLLQGVTPGSILPIRATRVLDTSTTALGLVGLY